MTSICERLQALQINLPEVPPPVVDGYVPSFVPFVRTGNLIYLSGRLAKKDGKPFSGNDAAASDYCTFPLCVHGIGSP
jgi:hypothetical protein